MLELLQRIKICIEYDSLDVVKELVKTEIENLKDLTQKNCEKYSSFDWYCNSCENLNCANNKNKLNSL